MTTEIKKSQIEEAVEQLRCALINCDNVKVLGIFFVEAVKMQIESALEALGVELLAE